MPVNPYPTVPEPRGDATCAAGWRRCCQQPAAAEWGLPRTPTPTAIRSSKAATRRRAPRDASLTSARASRRRSLDSSLRRSQRHSPKEG